MIRLRATKYDPCYRDADGRYQLDEWTSVGDVGKCVTIAEYLSIEDAYVAAIHQLLEVSNVETLKVAELENRHVALTLHSDICSLRPATLPAISNGLELKGGDIDSCVRMNLREIIWCKLTGDHGVFVHFGYDYYMYLGSEVDGAVLHEAPPGLFYERYASPHLNS